jgi:RHS repeat-associated protein
MAKTSAIHFLMTSGSGSTLDTDPYGYSRTAFLRYFGFCRASLGQPYYPLGSGRRFYHAVPRRFLQPDKLSPFGPGGLNSYTYCLNDPTNRIDPSGGASFFGWLARSIGKRWKRRPPKGLYKRPSRFSMGSADPLENHEPFELFREIDQYRSSRYEGKAIFIEDERSLNQLKRKKEYLFAMSRDGKIVTSPWDWRNHIPTHAALANRLGNVEVISAGIIKRKGKNFVSITNNSGHFKPGEGSLDYAAGRLSDFGASVQIKPWIPPEPWRIG